MHVQMEMVIVTGTDDQLNAYSCEKLMATTPKRPDADETFGISQQSSKTPRD